jgi:nitroreductase
MSIIETIHKRQSWRTFSPKPVETDKISLLRDFMSSNTQSVFGSAIRCTLINFEEAPMQILKTMGTYSVINGARLFMAGCVKKQGKCLEDYGYVMEKNILKAVELGLATCWLGATFDKNGFSDKLKCADDEIVPAVSPVGYAADKRRLADNLMRKVANSDTRKHLFEISFIGDFYNSHVPDNKYKAVLECVKLAPSATNQQPWRFLKDPKMDVFHLYLERTKGYTYPAGQNIDMGIAMAHFELAAHELKLEGKWTVEKPDVDAGDREYVATWRP